MSTVLMCIIECKPVSGKSFIIDTMRNITKITYNTNNADLSSAPTGCTAVLVYGSMHTRFCRIPIDGRTFKKTLNNIRMSELISIQVLKKNQLNSRFMEEHSMTGCLTWL